MFNRWKRRRSGEKGNAPAASSSGPSPEADADLPPMPAGLAAKLCFLLDWLNAHALSTDGLHRVAGNSSAQDELRAKVRNEARSQIELRAVRLDGAFGSTRVVRWVAAAGAAETSACRCAMPELSRLK